MEKVNKKPSEAAPLRTISLSDPSSNPKFVPNTINNSKYTALNFIPKNLYNQLKQHMNKYFLLIGILQSFPTLTPVNPWSTWVPLLFIFTLSALKELSDHLNTTRRDRAANEKKRSVFLNSSSERDAKSSARKQPKELLESDSEGEACNEWSPLNGQGLLRYRAAQTRTCDIRVGDLVEVRENEDIPCDLLLLASDREDGMCYLSTANLDGETNFKVRSCNAKIKENEDLLREKQRGEDKNSNNCNKSKNHEETPEKEEEGEVNRETILMGLTKVVCTAPNADLTDFKAKAYSPRATKEAGEEEGFYQMNEKNLLQQTCVLKNTPRIVDLAVSTGKETKFGMGHTETPYKLTSVERKTNGLTIFIFLFQIVVSLVFGVVGFVINTKRNPDDVFVLLPNQEKSFGQFMINFCRFLLLISSMIPISLKVCLDIFKMLHSKFLSYDKSIGVDKDIVIANNTSIPEELAQIEYILSDKTGTLTTNNMFLKEVSLHGRSYRVFQPSSWQESSSEGSVSQTPAFHGTGSATDPLLGLYDEGSVESYLFLCNMALNNSIQVNKSGNYDYTSPDELALVEGGHYFGLFLKSKSNDKVLLRSVSKTSKWEIGFELIEELEFTSERKCMSVIVRESSSGKVYLFSKGADEALGPKYKECAEKEVLLKEADRYASTGLRTLCFGYKELQESEVEEIVKKLFESKGNGDEYNEVCSAIERELTVSGVVAIEDALQENVAAVIKMLSQAHIKFWMITGDKSNTARQIAKNCSLVQGKLVELSANYTQDLQDNSHAVSRAVAKANGEYNKGVSSGRAGGYTLLMTGRFASQALEACRKEFLNLCLSAKSIVFSRVAPAMKSELVRMVRSAGKRVLAIGDGGNDVGMIQAANVGVGIRGKEGLQSAHAADFQVKDFQVLKNMLFFHGINAYRRMCRIIQISFYKSIFFCCMQIIYNFYTQFTGSSLYDTISILLYNAAMFFPILCMSFDMEILKNEVDTKGWKKYRSSKIGRPYKRITFSGWCVRGMFHGAIVLLLSLQIYQNEFSMTELGYFTYMCYLIIVYAVIFVEARTISYLQIVCSSVCFLGTVGCLLLFTEVSILANHKNYLSLEPIFFRIDSYFAMIGIMTCSVVFLKLYVVYVWKSHK